MQDPGVSPGIGRTRSFIGERRQVFEPAGSLEIPSLVEEFGNRNDVAGTTRLDEVGDSGEYQSVVLAVQVFGRDNVGDLVPGVGIEHQAADQGLFGLDGIGRHLDALLGGSRGYTLFQRSYHSSPQANRLFTATSTIAA